MINRFHSAAPSAAIPGANSQANKTKAGEGFALLLNALTGPIAEQQSQPHSVELLQDPDVKPEHENAATPFNRFVEVAEEVIGLSENDLFLMTPMPGAMAITLAQSLLAPMQTKVYLPQVSSSLFVVAQPENITDVAELSVTNETNPAPHDSIHTHTAISKHSATQGGDVEMVSMPWRLQANAAMSYQSTAQKLKDIGDAQSSLTTIIQATTTQGVDKNLLPSLLNNGSQYDGVKIDKALEFYRVSEAASTLANAFESTRSLRADSRASLVMWPQRVLHWLADGDATTAWVRDYQLDASGARTLVEALRCFAEQQGFSLRRIMLNGHEVWHFPSTF